MNPTISIIIPTYRNHSQLLDCLHSIKRLNYPHKRLQIVIIDNANQIELLKKTQSIFPFVSLSLSLSFKSKSQKLTSKPYLLLHSSTNLGYTQAINQAIPYCTSQLLFFTNDDLIFDSKSLAILTSHLLSDPSIGILGGYQYSKSNPSKPTYQGQVFSPWLGTLSSTHPQIHPHSVQFVTGSCLLISKQLFIQLGGFPSFYSPGMFEDLHLCLQSHRSGYIALLIPKAKFYHDPATTFNRQPNYKYYIWYRNKLLLLHHCFRWYHLLSTLLFQYLLITPARSILFRDGRLLPALRALKYYLTSSNKL